MARLASAIAVAGITARRVLLWRLRDCCGELVLIVISKRCCCYSEALPGSGAKRSGDNPATACSPSAIRMLPMAHSPVQCIEPNKPRHSRCNPPAVSMSSNAIQGTMVRPGLAGIGASGLPPRSNRFPRYRRSNGAATTTRPGQNLQRVFLCHPQSETSHPPIGCI